MDCFIFYYGDVMHPLVHRILKNKKRFIIAILAIALLISVKFIFFSHHSQIKPDAKIVEVNIAQLGQIQQTTRFIGTIRAQQSTMLVTKAKGIVDILVPSGTRVKKGDLLGKIRSLDVDHTTKLSQDAVAIAKVQYERALELFKKGVFSKNAVEEKKTIWIDAQKRLADAHLQLEQTNIEAPFAGIVGLFKIKDGSQVQEGEALVNLYDPSSLMVEFDVPINVVQTIKDHASIIVNNQTYPLTYIQRMVDEDTHMCPAYVNIQCDHCIIGTTTHVDVVMAEKRGVIVIPYEAIFLRDGKPYVYLMKDNKAVLTEVTQGLREKERVEITSGIKIGDKVILRGQSRLYPNAPVKLSDNTHTTKK